MNDFIAILILAVIQGIAEWFPVSSSAHLVLASKMMGFDNTLLIDVALHFGTLMAVFVYFGKEITDIVKDLLSFKFKTENGKMGILLIIATIPTAILGFLLRDFLGANINELTPIVFGLGITSIFLFIGSLDIGKKRKETLNYKEALVIGIVQCFSLFRGISRSGSTIVTGLLFGLSEKNAVKFSFLMSIPIVFGANLITVGNGNLPPSLFWASMVSFVVGLGTIHVLLKFVLTSRKNLRWFALYVMLLAIGLGIYLFI